MQPLRHKHAGLSLRRKYEWNVSRFYDLYGRHALPDQDVKHVGTEMSLHVLAYNLKRVMNILGVKPLTHTIQAYLTHGDVGNDDLAGEFVVHPK